MQIMNIVKPTYVPKPPSIAASHIECAHCLLESIKSAKPLGTAKSMHSSAELEMKSYDRQRSSKIS